MMGLCRRRKSELCEGLEAGYIFLGIFGEEGPEGSDLFHGVGFCKPSKAVLGRNPAPYPCIPGPLLP